MMNKTLNIVLIIGWVFCLISCDQNKNTENHTQGEATPIFNQLPSEKSGITFSNNLHEDSVINYFTYPYIYMGGGVAVGDINNDGLSDIYFTANMEENKLYLNRGDLKFEDITSTAGVGGDGQWMTGATMADVNADGWLDIYVSVSGKFASTKNLLFLNNGADENGIPTFTESAEKSGIADEGNSTQGAFFDYDKDGDLDLYVANYPPTGFKTPNFSYQVLIQQKSPEKSDKLYRNKGDGTFEDVTAAAGVLNFGLSLSATVGDFNNDGWEDIYVSNDFATPDIFYFNNGDGTFSEKIKETTQHTAYFGMGADAGDFNNDGLLDLVQMDMTPKDNRRSKANMASMNVASFWEIVGMGMHYQYMQNALQLNNGITKDGLPHFSDISRMAGMSSTDWSWAALFADLDNDGWKDVFITNGTRRDINNKDYFNKIDKANYQEKQQFNYLDLTKKMPAEKVDNYAFKNNGDLTFDNKIKDWGLSFKGFSNGAAYADLDNDGDLEMIINNIDEPAVVFQNMSTENKSGNYLRIKLIGENKNPLGIGAKVLINMGDELQMQHLTLSRGFQSSVEPVIHFGLGDKNTVDKITVTWPDGKMQVLENIPANQILKINYEEAVATADGNNMAEKNNYLFTDITADLNIDFQHRENPYNDFAKEVLLPHGYSKMGPGLAVGDVNGDGLEDFYIGGAIGQHGVLYEQDQNGKFSSPGFKPWGVDAPMEDMGALFFDADADGDLDLYVVSGGNENEPTSPKLQDRLYINDGKGDFEKSVDALPEMLSSGSRVKAADYDGDGDLDLFVGGRLVPQSYPLPAKSYILRNDTDKNSGLKFTDVTEAVAPDLVEAGLVTDAVWVDYDQDDKMDLVITGEWMPITFLKNTGGKFVNKTEKYGLEKSTGWWYSIAAADFDQDGDVDLVAGNLGLNYKYQANSEKSFDVYAADFDKNGKLDIVLGYYNDGEQYPVRGRQCSSEQIPAIKAKFKDYDSFAGATLEDVYTKEDLAKALRYQAWNFASSYIENKGGEQFEIRNLPNAVQVSCVNGMVVEDFNQDGHLDLLLAGNLYSSEVETTRNDASYGHYLLGDGKGNFHSVPNAESGLFLNYDTKDLAKIKTPSGVAVLVVNNNDVLKVVSAFPPVN
ncbi:MAG: VCBS repeat-containing protein [Saprospiraceae bacterium]